MIEIPLTQGKVAIVDVDDLHLLVPYIWSYSKARSTEYAAGRVVGKLVFMHRRILGEPKGYVDHINGDGLDNRRCNLRVCSNSENLRNRSRPQNNNTSGVRGVHWHKGAKKWMARVKLNYTEYYLGLFTSLEAAEKARDDAARRLHGEFFSPGRGKQSA